MDKTILKKYSQDLLKLFLIIILSVLILNFGWYYINSTTIFGYLSELLFKISGQSIETLTYFFNNPIDYNPLTNTLIHNGKSWDLIMPVRSYQYFFVLSLFVFVLPLKKYHTVLVYVLSTATFIVIRSLFVMIVMIYGQETSHLSLLSWLANTIYLPVLFWIFYCVKNNDFLTQYYNLANESILRLCNFSIQKIVLLILLLTPVPKILIVYFNGISIIESAILNVSKSILLMAGYEPVLNGDRIFLANNWLRLGEPCIGIGVMTVVVLFIFIMKGRNLNRIVYSIFFVLTFSIINSIRLSLTLIYIHIHYGKQYLDLQNIHDSITYLMYIIAFTFMITYILWFENLELKKRTKNI